MHMKKTPLYNNHVALGGKIVPFAGWELPVQYAGVIPEHHATRTQAGLFDVSHMGEIFVTGKEAETAIQFLTCNDLSKIVDGQAQYSALLNENGGVVDDIIVYRYNPKRYLICVNASNADIDFEWMKSHNKFDCVIENRSADFGQIALQGPKAETILTKILSLSKAKELKYFHFGDFEVLGSPVIVARTGYTGEDGFEIFVPQESTAKVWELLLEAGKDEGLQPCGLGARDSLRLEACYPLHGHELNPDINALHSGLGWIIKPDKGDFIGKRAIMAEKEKGVTKQLVAFEVIEPGIVRENAAVSDKDGTTIGHTTSGTKTPTLNKAVGLAIIDKKFAALETVLFCEVRGRKLKCKIVKKPLYFRGAIG